MSQVFPPNSNKVLKVKRRFFILVLLFAIILAAVLATIIVLKTNRNINITQSTVSTKTTTQKPFACSNMTILYGIDLRGSDTQIKNFSNYSQCCSWCLSISTCKSFTWGLPIAGWAAYTCFVKNKVPTKINSSIVVSAHY